MGVIGSLILSAAVIWGFVKAMRWGSKQDKKHAKELRLHPRFVREMRRLERRIRNLYP